MRRVGNLCYDCQRLAALLPVSKRAYGKQIIFTRSTSTALETKPVATKPEHRDDGSSFLFSGFKYTPDVLRTRNWKLDAHGIVHKALGQMISSHGLSADAFPIADISDFKRWAQEFMQANKSSEESKRIWSQLWRAYIAHERLGVKRELWKQYELQRVQKNFSTSDRLNQKRIADLRYPLEWYPEARAMHRTIHLHLGPTNSGKTYHALQSLENSNSGVYAGPLRLLANEVCGRLNARGKMCDLITGEERRLAQEGGSPLVSCTVEMISLTREVDVAVIDEIQMIGDSHRGWAWTEALLSVRAKEVHLCGEERVEPLIQRLADAMGDKLVVHRYERLTPLRTEAQSLHGDIRNLRKGDCLVVFNRMRIHALRDQIQEATGLKAALIYGSLPPASRNEQASLFNDPNSGYDILIASDAIGMGLNLNIRRIIISTLTKSRVMGLTATPSEIRQIAGRAGRFYVAEGIEPYRTGFVTTLYDEDYEFVKEAMEGAAVPLPTAGILPPPAIIHQHAAYFPADTPFEIILLSLAHICQTNELFHMCDPFNMIRNARVIDRVEGLSITDRIALCFVPVGKDMELFKRLALCIAEQQRVSILDIPELRLDTVDEVRPKNPRKFADFMDRLEWLHQGIVLYIWMSLRFPNILMHRELATKAKIMVEEKIGKTLHLEAHHRLRHRGKRPPRPSFRIHGRQSWHKPQAHSGATAGTLPGPGDWRRTLAPHLLSDMLVGGGAYGRTL